MAYQRLTDYDIQALVDNEISPKDAELVLKQLEKNHAAHERYKELIKQKNLLKLWWGNQKN